MSDFTQYLLKNRLNLVKFIPIFIILAVALSLISPIQYRATSQLLIIHRISPGLDAYSSARAAEKLTETLGQVIYTSSFLDTVEKSQNFNLSSYLPENETDRRRAWKNLVQTNVDGSILEINTYDTDPQKATYLNYLILQTLIQQGQEFHGAGESASIKMVNKPLNSSLPARPNIILNVLIGAVFGLLTGYLILLNKFYKKLPEKKQEENSLLNLTTPILTNIDS